VGVGEGVPGGRRPFALLLVDALGDLAGDPAEVALKINPLAGASVFVQTRTDAVEYKVFPPRDIRF
jgi:hypothetical protein